MPSMKKLINGKDILIIKDENNNIFGGYTSKNFKSNVITRDVKYGSKKKDITAFLFNLNKNEIS